MLLNPFTYHAPTSARDAVKLCAAHTDARILAGGTLLINTLKQIKKKGGEGPKHIISLSKIDALKGVTANKTQLTIGAMATINDLFYASCLSDNWPVLRRACKNIATNPIRNMATVGGNLTGRYAWTELGAVCIALDATLHFLNADGKPHAISAEDFFNAQAKSNGILTQITVPKNTKQCSNYQRITKLSPVDVPLLAVCIAAACDKNRFADARVVINNGAAFAQRDNALENFLNGAAISNATADEAPNHITQDIGGAPGNEHKNHMLHVAIKNAITNLIAQQRK